VTELAAAILTVRPTGSCALPRWSGPHFRTWFLKQVRHYNPVIADTLQTGDKLRPYTVSILFNSSFPSRDHICLTPEQTYTLRITTLWTPLTRLLLERFLPDIQGQTIQIADTLFQIENYATRPEDHPGANITSDTALIQQHTLHTDVIPRSLGLEFVSPTVFHSLHGLVTPFPFPALVFGSLIDRWNTFNEVRLHPDTRRFAEEGIETRHHRIHTNRVILDMDGQVRHISGFQGQCHFSILRGDRYWQGVIHTLAKYAFYAGVGAHTTMGLGQVRLTPTKRQGI